MKSVFNAGVEAAAKVMEDLDHGGWFAEAIRERVKRVEPTRDGILHGMAVTAAEHFGLKPESDDPNWPEILRCMEAILTRLQADDVVN